MLISFQDLLTILVISSHIFAFISNNLTARRGKLMVLSEDEHLLNACPGNARFFVLFSRMLWEEPVILPFL